jgi:sialate O-acetylesterase
MRIGSVLSLLCAIALVNHGSCAVKLPNAIASNMVLQREPLAPRLWGFATASEAVTVEMDGKVWSATADAQGNWKVDLDVQKASVGKVVTISGKDGPPIILSNLAFGDVYLVRSPKSTQYASCFYDSRFNPSVFRSEQYGILNKHGL